MYAELHTACQHRVLGSTLTEDKDWSFTFWNSWLWSHIVWVALQLRSTMFLVNLYFKEYTLSSKSTLKDIRCMIFLSQMPNRSKNDPTIQSHTPIKRMVVAVVKTWQWKACVLGSTPTVTNNCIPRFCLFFKPRYILSYQASNTSPQELKYHLQLVKC